MQIAKAFFAVLLVAVLSSYILSVIGAPFWARVLCLLLIVFGAAVVMRNVERRRMGSR